VKCSLLCSIALNLSAYKVNNYKNTINIPEIDLKDYRLRKAYLLFLKHKRLRAVEYQLLVGLGRTQSVADLNKLIKQGLIKKVGGGRSQTYIISE